MNEERPREFNKAVILKLMQSFEQKDTEGFLELCADDCILIDPHYPRIPLKGKRAIRQGLEWTFKTLEKPVFDVRRIWIDGDEAVVYVDPRHRLKNGITLNVPQLFRIQWNGQTITLLQSFLPYRPGGLVGLIIRFHSLLWKLLGKGKPTSTP